MLLIFFLSIYKATANILEKNELKYVFFMKTFERCVQFLNNTFLSEFQLKFMYFEAYLQSIDIPVFMIYFSGFLGLFTKKSS